MDILGKDIPAWLLILILTVVLFYLYSTWTFDTFKKVGIPGPKPWPLVGNSPEFFQQGPDEFFASLKKKYGNIYGIFEGMKPSLVVFDPDILKQVLIKEFRSLPNRRNLPILDPPLDESILVAEVEPWKRLRCLITPAFTTGKLRQMTSEVNSCADLFVKGLESYAESLKSFDLKVPASAFTNDVISRVGFGVTLDPQKNPDDPLLQNINQMFKQNPMTVAFAFTFPGVVNFLRYQLGLRLFDRGPITFMRRLIDRLIQERQENKQDHNDFLQMMLNAHESQSSDVVDEEVDRGGPMAQSKVQKYASRYRLN